MAGRHGVALILRKPVAIGVTPEIIVDPHSFR
jgi:hypothetical protein